MSTIAKEFESKIKKQLFEIKNVYPIRLYDFIGARDYPSDFIVYKKPNLICLECKTCQLKSFPFSNISDTQWTGMLGAIKKAIGVKAYVIIWFYMCDKTLLCSMKTLEQMKAEGYKSIRYDMQREGIYEVKGTKKSKYYTYDFEKLLKQIAEEK